MTSTPYTATWSIGDLVRIGWIRRVRRVLPAVATDAALGPSSDVLLRDERGNTIGWVVAPRCGIHPSAHGPTVYLNRAADEPRSDTTGLGH